MGRFFILFLCFFMLGCNLNKTKKTGENYKLVTVETSGELYMEEGGDNVQIDLFGSCVPGQSVIYIHFDEKTKGVLCHNGRYRYSMNLSKSFLRVRRVKGNRSPSSKYVTKKVSVFHQGEGKQPHATSYILIDVKKREVKSVINETVKLEKPSAGKTQHVVQFNAFGSCASGTNVKLNAFSSDQSGQSVLKYEKVKECQKSGNFYFLSQLELDGHMQPGIHFEISEFLALGSRRPASREDKKPRVKSLWYWDSRARAEDL